MNNARGRKPDPWAAALAAETLAQANEAVGKLIPAPDAGPSEWKAYYERSVKVYERIAEVDRAHHHEALYWVSRERANFNRVDLADVRATSANDGGKRGGRRGEQGST